jgi:hypothetical protein
MPEKIKKKSKKEMLALIRKGRGMFKTPGKSLLDFLAEEKQIEKNIEDEKYFRHFPKSN